MTLALSDSARRHIAEQGFDPVYGARPLKRFMQRELETRIGRALIEGSVADGSQITVELENDALVVRHSPPLVVEETATS